MEIEVVPYINKNKMSDIRAKMKTFLNVWNGIQLIPTRCSDFYELLFLFNVHDHQFTVEILPKVAAHQQAWRQVSNDMTDGCYSRRLIFQCINVLCICMWNIFYIKRCNILWTVWWKILRCLKRNIWWCCFVCRNSVCARRGNV